MAELVSLVETDWLLENLGSPEIMILDATWHMPNLGRNALQEYMDNHITGAQFFDIDAVADTKSDLPHMLPSAETFNIAMDKMAITNDTHIIVYDSYGFLSCARLWWTFNIMGHKKVSILNGGLKKWMFEKKPTTSEATMITSGQGYSSGFSANMVKSIEQIHQHINNNDMQILDARSAGRFAGKDPEPRPGLSSGHMPNSFNLPFNLLANQDGTLKNKAEIKSLFLASEINLSQPISTTCGSGITAANLFFALDYLGVENLSLYDGSWTEYAANIDSIIIKDIK